MLDRLKFEYFKALSKIINIYIHFFFLKARVKQKHISEDMDKLPKTEAVPEQHGCLVSVVYLTGEYRAGRVWITILLITTCWKTQVYNYPPLTANLLKWIMLLCLQTRVIPCSSPSFRFAEAYITSLENSERAINFQLISFHAEKSDLHFV